MTEQQHPQNLPAIVQARPVAAQPADTDSWTTVVGEVAKLATYIADTEFVPRALRGKAPAAAAAMLYGREVGMPPMTALTSVHIIEGSPSLSAEQQRSMVLAAGHDLEFVESTGAHCVVRGRRRGSETWTTVEWTLDMARAAGLLGKTNWKSWPRRMLQARASSELCEMVFPDVIRGLRAAEDIEDERDETAAGETAAAPRTTSKVARKSAARKPAPAAGVIPSRPATRPATGGEIPLPGEAGYDDVSSGSGTAASTGSAAPSPAQPDPGNTSSDGDSRAPRDPSEDPHTPADDGTDTVASGGAVSSPGPSSAGPQDVENPVDEQEIVDAEIVGEDPPQRIAEVRPAQRRMILSKFSELGLKNNRDERLRISGILIGRPISSTNDLSKDEAGTLIDTLALCNSLEQLVQVAAQTEAAEAGE